MKTLGFTLVELLVTLAIAGVLLSIVGSYSVSTSEKAKARNEFSQLRNIVDRARSEALLKSKAITIQFEGFTFLVDDGVASEKKRNQFVSCENSIIRFNSRGFANRSSVTCSIRGIERKIIFNKRAGSFSE